MKARAEKTFAWSGFTIVLVGTLLPWAHVPPQTRTIEFHERGLYVSIGASNPAIHRRFKTGQRLWLIFVGDGVVGKGFVELRRQAGAVV